MRFNFADGSLRVNPECVRTHRAAAMRRRSKCGGIKEWTGRAATGGTYGGVQALECNEEREVGRISKTASRGIIKLVADRPRHGWRVSGSKVPCASTAPHYSCSCFVL